VKWVLEFGINSERDPYYPTLFLHEGIKGQASLFPRVGPEGANTTTKENKILGSVDFNRSIFILAPQKFITS
jgi:hypothetical protein